MKLLWIISYNTPSMHALVHAEVKNSCSLKWNMNIKHVVTIYNFEMRVREQTVMSEKNTFIVEK